MPRIYILILQDTVLKSMGLYEMENGKYIEGDTKPVMEPGKQAYEKDKKNIQGKTLRTNVYQVRVRA